MMQESLSLKVQIDTMQRPFSDWSLRSAVLTVELTHPTQIVEIIHLTQVIPQPAVPQAIPRPVIPHQLYSTQH